MEENKNIEESKKQATLYKIFFYISIFLTFALIGVIIASITQFIEFTSTTFSIVASLLVLSVSMATSLPWIRRLFKKEHRVVSIVMLALIGVFAAILISDIIVGVNGIYRGARDGWITEAQALRYVKYIQSTLVLNLQIFFAIIIANRITRFGKNFLVLQIFNYTGYALIDYWVSSLFLLIRFHENSVSFGNWKGLFSQGMLFLFLFAIAIIAVTEVFTINILGGKTKTGRRRRFGRGISDSIAEHAEIIAEMERENNELEQKKDEKSLEQKLKELKDLLDKGVITKEEYDEKRNKLLGDY